MRLRESGDLAKAELLEEMLTISFDLQSEF